MNGERELLRQELDDSVLMHTGRSVGDIGSDRVMDDLWPLVDRIAAERAAAELERMADERTWTTEHDNEVVSVRDLYEQIARLRGELEPVTYDFPPAEDDRAAALRAATGEGAGQ